MPIPSATTWKNILKNCRRSTHKKFGFPGYHLKRNLPYRVRICKFLLEVYEDCFPKPVDKSFPNVLTSRGIFFWSRWKSLFEIPNIVRDIQKLDEQVMYLYNGGTAVIRYINNWIPMFHHKSVSSDTISVHRKYRTAPPRLWFCWREL